MELRAIERTDRGINRLNAALRIYRETILPEAQNPERQILYWIDNSKLNVADQFRCFALVDGTAVVGYLQYSYFAEEHTFFFEYLCLREANRTGLAVSGALKKIEDYLVHNYRDGFTVVFEVAQQRGELGTWEQDGKLIKYFKRIGFRVVNFAYKYPVLQSYVGEMSYPADLMIRLPEGRKDVISSELRAILRCVYFKHYLKWDRPFLNADELFKREQLIDNLYSQQVSQIGEKKSFGTWGDEKRTQIILFARKTPSLKALTRRIFAPKFPRLVAATLVTLGAFQLLGNAWSLIPFVLTVSAIFCLAEDTESSRQLLHTIISKISLGRPQK